MRSTTPSTATSSGAGTPRRVTRSRPEGHLRSVVQQHPRRPVQPDGDGGPDPARARRLDVGGGISRAPRAEAPVAAVLGRFTRAIGLARAGKPGEGRPEVAALDALARELETKEPYWSRVAGIKRDAARAWVLFQSGDSVGGLALAAAAAGTEEITDKHPVTPAELLPARELYGDMLLAAGRYPEARAAYRATLARERGRARSLFGLARAAELAGDHAAASEGYDAYLTAMKRSDGSRPDLATARGFPRKTPER